MVEKTRKGKTIRRKCVVCGKLFGTQIWPDGHYHGGHYFGKMKIPVGKGENKKIGTVRLDKNRYDVVKWTGKERTVEYWECDTCFNEAAREGWLEEKIEKLFGKRCQEFGPGCPSCGAWSVLDAIKDDNRGEL